MADQAAGLLVPGNIDLNNRPRVKNADGSISTVRSIGVNVDGKEVLIPTVVGDRVVSNADAVKEYKRTGQHLGIFDTPAHSDAYAQQLHEDQAALIAKPMANDQALGAEDYQQLRGMVMSDDPKVQAQGQALAKKLTPDEQQAFFDYQKTVNVGKGERTRVDNSVGGLPPELAAVSALGIGRAVAAPGLSIVARGMAGVKAAAGQAAPVIKYELVKSGLEHMGVPSPLAMAGAMAVTGYKRGAGKAAVEAPVAAEAAPVAAEAIGAPVGAPAAPPTSPMAAASVAQPAPAGPAAAAPEARVPAQPLAADSTLSPQAVADRLAAKAAPVAARPDLPKELIEANKLGTTPKALNELALAARRAKITLSPADYQAGLKLMKDGGVSADTAIGTLTQQRIAPVAAPEVPKLTAAEMVQAQKWKAAGATDDQIMQRVQLSRALTSATGTPTPEEAAAAMRTLKATKYKQ